MSHRTYCTYCKCKDQIDHEEADQLLRMVGVVLLRTVGTLPTYSTVPIPCD